MTAAVVAGNAQDKLYADEFPLGDVTLLDGPLKKARNLNIETLLKYMISELQLCADANIKNHPDWGKGYVGGMPNSERIWSNFKKGDFGVYFGSWAPFYNLHKMYAGLRDAWLYCGNEQAKTEDYAIPADLLKGKTQVRVKFVAKSGKQVGEIYGVRLIKQ